MTTQDANRAFNDSLSLGSSDIKPTAKPQHNKVHTLINCTNPHVSVTAQTNDDGFVLLTFSTPEHDVEMTSLSCGVHMTSQQDEVISAVMLEHSPCDGGVFVLLWDSSTRRRWDVCSVWHVPGPDFMTASNMLDVTIEVVDVTDRSDFSVSVRAMEKPSKGELELKYLSLTAGTYFCFSVKLAATVLYLSVSLSLCLCLSSPLSLSLSLSLPPTPPPSLSSPTPSLSLSLSLSKYRRL